MYIFLVLFVFSRAGGSSSSNVMEFEFRATNSTTVAILKRWNIVLMESIAASCGDPEQMNFIGKVLNKRVAENPDGGRLTKSFRKGSQSMKEKHSDAVKRSGSFSNSRSATLHPGMLNSNAPSPKSSKSGHNSPQKMSHGTNFSSSTNDMIEIAKPSRIQSTPPPLPPRPILDCSSSGEDSDYAYIEEDKVKGPTRRSHSPSQDRGSHGSREAGERTLDQELEDLEKSMKREKKEKKRQEKRKAATIATRSTQQRPPLFFTPADPEDYLEPLSALSNNRPRSTEYEPPVIGHNRACSEPDNTLYPDSKSLSQPTIHSIRHSPPHLSTTHHKHRTPPTLPSREWRSVKENSSNCDDPDISPYAVVRQVLPGRILEETDAPNVSRSKNHQLPLAPLISDKSSVTTATDSVVSSTVTTPPSSSTSTTTTVDSVESTAVPPIPPRSPIKEKLSWSSSTSSVTSNHSLRSTHTHQPGVRCSKCQRQRRVPVDKTMSEHRGQPVPQTMPPSQKSSLPDLNTAITGVPENTLQHRRQKTHRGRITSTTESRSSSDGSTSSLQAPANYLEIMPTDTNSAQSGKGGRNSNPESLQMLDDVMRCFDDKVNSLTQLDGSPEAQKRVPVSNSPSLPQNSSPHSFSDHHHVANGHGPSRRQNVVKEPPPLQRSHTSASFTGHSQSHTHHIIHNKSCLSFVNNRAPPPPVPPRSDVSLSAGQSSRYPSTNHHQPIHTSNYHSRAWARTGSSGSFSSTSGDSRSPPALYGTRTRQSSSSSIHSGSPSPTIGPTVPHPPRSWQNLARHFTNVPNETDGSSTVFIHHLKQDRRVMHSHMV